MNDHLHLKKKRQLPDLLTGTQRYIYKFFKKIKNAINLMLYICIYVDFFQMQSPTYRISDENKELNWLVSHETTI